MSGSLWLTLLMPATSIRLIEGNAIIDLDARDLHTDYLCHQVSERLSEARARQAVINLEQITALSSGEWSEILTLSHAIQLIGIRVAMCGVRPALAMTLIEFNKFTPIDAYLDVDGALHAITTN